MFISVLQTALQSLIFFALHFKSNGSFPRQLSAKEERECLEKAAQGDLAARDKLINHNLRLVAYIVKKHYPDSKEADDLISIGIIGLIRAAETFDYRKNISFSTYAGKCINNQIRMYFRKTKHQQTEVYMNDPMDCDKDGNAVTLADIFKDGTDVAEEAALNIELDKMYRYIDEELDEQIQQVIAENTDDSMTQEEKLKVLYDYTVNSFSYLRRNYYAIGETGWQNQEAYTMLSTGMGNCYCYAATFGELARAIGYDAQAYSGTVGSNRAKHSWVEIEIDGVNYTFDSELEMAGRKKYVYRDMYMMTPEQARIWNYKR